MSDTSKRIKMLEDKLERANQNIVSLTDLMEMMYIDVQTVKQSKAQFTFYTS